MVSCSRYFKVSIPNTAGPACFGSVHHGCLVAQGWSRNRSVYFPTGLGNTMPVSQRSVAKSFCEVVLGVPNPPGSDPLLGPVGVRAGRRKHCMQVPGLAEILLGKLPGHQLPPWKPDFKGRPQATRPLRSLWLDNNRSGLLVCSGTCTVNRSLCLFGPQGWQLFT